MLRQYPKQKSKENQLAFFAALFTQVKLAGQLRLKQNRKKNHFPSTSSQFGAHSQSPCYSEQTCAAIFASHLNSHFGVELYYTEYLLGIATYSDQQYYSEWNSTIRRTYLEQHPTPISTWNRNSTRVGAGGCVWRRLCAWNLWGNVLRSVTGKTESSGGVRSNQFIDGTQTWQLSVSIVLTV